MRLQELKCFEGGKNLVHWLPEPVDGDHQHWKLGTNSAGGSMRALRMLMPMGMALDILEHADMSTFVKEAAGVECHPYELRIPEHPVWFIKDGELTETRLTDIHFKVHCKTVELPLNFHQVMVRCQFRTPGKGALSWENWLEKCSRYIKRWIELIVVEKRRQIQTPTEMWLAIPWDVNTLWTMPIVLWLSKPRDNRKRGVPWSG
jgi:hypothetical protein